MVRLRRPREAIRSGSTITTLFMERGLDGIRASQPGNNVRKQSFALVPVAGSLLANVKICEIRSHKVAKA